jgi:hypothetical protein
VVFGLGWGAIHKSLPFAAAVLAAIPAEEPPSLPAPARSIASGTSEASGISGASGAEVAELIAKLGELRDAGVLTEEEFQAKKTELLFRL